MSTRSLLSSSSHYKRYTSFASDINLLADGPSPRDDFPCRQIIVTSGGSLMLRPPGGASDASDDQATGNLPAGTVLNVQVARIVAGGSTTVTDIFVLW